MVVNKTKKRRRRMMRGHRGVMVVVSPRQSVEKVASRRRVAYLGFPYRLMIVFHVCCCCCSLSFTILTTMPPSTHKEQKLSPASLSWA